MERDACFQSFFFICLGFPNKQGLLINQNLTFLSKSPAEQRPLPGPPSGACMEKDAHFQSLSFHTLQDSQ